MKAQVLHKYDPEMKEGTWVTNQEMPDPCNSKNWCSWSLQNRFTYY